MFNKSIVVEARWSFGPTDYFLVRAYEHIVIQIMINTHIVN